VVRRHLAVVPGARTLVAVEAVDQGPQAGIGGEQCIEHRRHFGEHAFGQIARVAARIGRRLVRLVQRLRDVQRLLHIEAELTRTHFLQGAQVERQRRCLAHALGVHRHDLRIACRANAIRSLLRHRLLKAATRCIRAAFGRHPVRDEGLAGMG